MMADAIMKVRDLNRTFYLENGEQQILKGINLDIMDGDFTVVMGASGSGKSTFLYCISGMDKPTSGDVIFGDTNLTSLDTDQLAKFRRKHCGFVFQQICLVDSLSVMDNVMAAGLLANDNRKEVYDNAVKLLGAVGIEEHTWSKFPAQISGGRAQRVGIVRALINNPGLLFADEPTGALNSQTGKEVLDQFTEFNNKGQSIIMVTHDFRSALRGNRILYLKDGNVLDECRISKYKGDDEDRANELKSFLNRMGW